MTLEEKIKIITAFSEGKAVEIYSEASDEWFAKYYDVWDFEESKYRIKPQVKPKFKQGDVLVNKEENNKPNPTLFLVEEVSDEGYMIDNSIITDLETIENEFVSERDVLWYFEIYDYVTEKFYMRSTRMTMNEMDEEFGANHYTLSWKPMYNLGFRLKEND